MIFYFTGTGNSFWVADALGKALNEPVLSVATELQKAADSLSYHLKDTEIVCFVFPIHSWGPAVEMVRFIKTLHFENYHKQSIYSICVCGDDCGNADRFMKRLLKQKDYLLSGCYSVIMPNNYILLPGFDVDSEALAKKKLSDAPAVITRIADQIRTKSSEMIYSRGSFSGIKTSCIYPLFVKYALRKQYFRVTDACTGCGKCARICPTQTIRMEHKTPVWGEGCVQCLACIHRCPVRAIEYGKETLKKGRYHHPDCK